ncbi:MAG: hypothetical protein IRZ28_21850 [Steroidobacteraceae bacterium]|nr:hypothetical protein [Steroidobacteraceae bacterium]
MDLVQPIFLALAVAFGVILVISWICLPFALFGIKGRLDNIIRLMEQERDKKQRVDPQP